MNTRTVRLVHTPKLLADARVAGCPAGQLELFLRGGYVPQPKQMQFHAAARLCDSKGGPTEIAFGGARGPGKSHAMLAQIALDDCQRFPGLKALMLRKILVAGKRSFEDLRLKILRGVSHNYNKSTGEVTFPNGSRVVLGHFKDDRSFEAQIGLEYDLIGIEEATTLSSAKYRAIRTCQRSSKRGWRPRTYSNANPGGEGHAWYKDRFVIPWRTAQQNGTRFIPATFRDNVFLNEEYEGILDSLVGWQKRAWKDGDWDISAGQYFSNFDLDVHKVPPIKVETWWSVWLAMDTGWTHPTFVLLFTEDPQGNIFVVDEYYASRRLPKGHSNMIHEMLAHRDIHPVERLEGIYVGQDAWSKDREGRCVADSYEALGWSLDKARMDRIAGASLVLEYLGDVDAGIPATLYICENCVKLLETIPRLEHDEHRPEDVLKCDIDEEGIGGDDAYDALRYGLLSRESVGGFGYSVVRY